MTTLEAKTLDETPLKELEILSKDECDGVRARIHSLREHWIRRRPELPFFTLGTASYLDATNGRSAEYRAGAARTNPLLAEHFSDVHERVLEALSEELGERCRLDPSLAYPGFHVFGYHPLFTRPMASMHFDLQYESIDWSDVGPVDFDRQLSVTLSIRLPGGGGGLRVWNINNVELRAMSEQQAAEHRRANAQPEYHPYREGTMVLHSGHQLHQIAPAPSMVESDERLTLQAHALPSSNGWVVYW